MDVGKTIKVRRNDPCPCGSGIKYKKCCLASKHGLDLKTLYLQRYRIRLKEPGDIEGIRSAGRLVLETLDLVETRIRAGLVTDEINSLVHEFTVRNGAIPAPLHYHGFPKSVCVSVNEVVCHGIPGNRVLQEGDIVNVDVTTILNGYYADAGKTFLVGSVGPQGQEIVRVARASLRVGLSKVRPGNTVGDIGAAIQEYAEGEGCSVVREFTGHGVGFAFHEAPQIPHFGKKGEGILLVPGMVFTVEPMINLGKKEIVVLDDEWTVVTKDGSLSAQFEQTVLVTESGCESLTPFDL
ncbi:MAG: type I methionyl aminopeptidase [Nitrospirota bacterium]